MAAFFPEVLDAFLSPAFLEDVRTKFHYGDTKTAAFQAVAQEMLPLMRKEAFWDSRAFSAENHQPGESADAVYESVIMSLGGGLDALQERYSEEGRLSESYMLEVLAGELLLKGYGAYNRYVQENRDRHVARYHFLGSEEAFPLELLPELVQEPAGQVVCNAAFCLIPKKSVVFVSELTQDSKVQCESICVGCHNLHCPNRSHMENSYRFFENRDCKYFPCHEGVDVFNCLFCYCPLYLREHCPGNPCFIERDGRRIKDCTNCTFPHRYENYDAVIKLLRE